jgi:hypothetical protein
MKPLFSVPKPNSFVLGRGAIVSLARQMARNAAREQIRAQGKHPCRMKASDIEAMAQEYLEGHPELYWEALDRAIKIGLINPEDRERFLDLLEITQYFVGSDRKTETAKIATENTGEIPALKG